VSLEALSPRASFLNKQLANVAFIAALLAERVDGVWHVRSPDAVMPSAPRTMSDPSVRQRRRAMLNEPHIRPLSEFVESLRTDPNSEVPDFDPADGGVEATLLFLFEKPGPMTSADARGRRVGSGFISRDNDDPTAEATFNFMALAGIRRSDTVLWNVVPRWNGTRKINATELAEGVTDLGRLLTLLPRVRGIVLVGRKAQRASPLIEKTGISVFQSIHPSPLVRAARPTEWREIPRSWAHAAAAIGLN
jgi:hypothetical protein